MLFIKRMIACFSCLMLFFFSSAAAETGRYSTQFIDTFDTVITLIGYAPSQEAFDAYAGQAHARLQELHRLYDAYNAYDGLENIYTLNQKAALAPVAVSPELMDLLLFCKENQPLTQGAVNIALGGVLRLWHDAREAAAADPASAALPDRAALEAAALHADIDDLILDPQAGTVYYADPLLQLDVGAVAKGFATEIVAAGLQEAGFSSFLINAGGNVRVVGVPDDPSRSAWIVGIQDPIPTTGETASASLIETFYAIDLSVVTSGIYQRFYTVEGKAYHHLIDPATLMPGEHFLSVSVLTRDSGLADLLSTAAFLLPYQQSRALIEGWEGVEALWVMPDGEIVMTEGAAALRKGG